MCMAVMLLDISEQEIKPKKGEKLSLSEFKLFPDPSAKNCSIKDLGSSPQKHSLMWGKTQNISQEVNQAKQRNDFCSTTTYKSPFNSV